MTSKIIYWIGSIAMFAAAVPLLSLFLFVSCVQKIGEYVELHAVYGGNVDARDVDRWKNGPSY